MTETYNKIEEKIRRFVDKSFKNRLENYTLELSRGAEDGVNWLGTMHRVAIKGSKESGEKVQFNLIVKFAPCQPLFRGVLPIRNVYDREIYVYNKIIPEYLKIQEEKGVEDMFNPFAVSYASTMDDGVEALLMEDMKVRGFHNCDHQMGVNYNHASIIMRSLGKFHALSYAVKNEKPEIFADWRDACPESFFNSTLYEPIISMVQSLSAAILKTYGDDEAKTRDIFRRSTKNIPAIFKGLLDLDQFGKYLSISYGDYQFRNFLFKYENSADPHQPTDICMLDFQCLKLGTPAYDISYFIGTCTDGELRQAHYHQLIREYYESFSSFLSRLGSDPEVVFPYDVLLDHLRRFSVFGMYIGIWLVALDQKPTDNLPDLHNSADMESLVHNLSVVPNETYIRRMRDLISDYIQYGYNL
ncbi:hypothetical protein PPYR_12933 [Photinus pyralis]|uniref:CHK kinase-like domain-containing protein n=1 Tax=Photinus pyralis TaxID=7054 RepID=A0A1Y1N105_PHOPY|nr:uncharacterized protein LOC116179098 [Photinus pyralis]XP_031354668.1 uncharacterized protein LOC116179098 [Photinus pyralis]KAB0793313.1 hypothetical protein PPYR_12933 [Photinus pyralis]